jgi:hypothetical protein
MPGPTNNNIRMIIRAEILEIIRNDLTISRGLRGLRVLNENEIRQFCNDNNGGIEEVITEMIRDYEENGELNDLLYPQPMWIYEYLYDVVNTQI